MTLEAILLAATLATPWQPVGAGVWQREIRLADHGPMSLVRAIVVRIDPARVRFSLDTATRDYGTRGAWSVDRLPPGALVAANTGQFVGGVVWGWVVRDGVELGPPGTGTLAMSFVVGSTGEPALLTQAELAGARGKVRLAFQSYPALLTGEGELPWALQGPGRGVNLDHRDSRLAVGILADGSVVIALTRLFGSSDATLPWGPTVVEMAALMSSLGCRRAMMLDGGISSQLSLRYRNGRVRSWSNWRQVPMGLIVAPRNDSTPPARVPNG